MAFMRPAYQPYAGDIYQTSLTILGPDSILNYQISTMHYCNKGTAHIPEAKTGVCHSLVSRMSSSHTSGPGLHPKTTYGAMGSIYYFIGALVQILLRHVAYIPHRLEVPSDRNMHERCQKGDFTENILCN